MSACGQLTDKKLPRTPRSGLSALGCGSRSFDVAFISAILYFKKSKKPRRQCDEASGRARGGWSKVWALHAAINGPRGFDL